MKFEDMVDKLKSLTKKMDDCENWDTMETIAILESNEQTQKWLVAWHKSFVQKIKAGSFDANKAMSVVNKYLVPVARGTRKMWFDENRYKNPDINPKNVDAAAVILNILEIEYPNDNDVYAVEVTAGPGTMQFKAVHSEIRTWVDIRTGRRSLQFIITFGWPELKALVGGDAVAEMMQKDERKNLQIMVAVERRILDGHAEWENNARYYSYEPKLKEGRLSVEFQTRGVDCEFDERKAVNLKTLRQEAKAIKNFVGSGLISTIKKIKEE